MVQDIKSNRQLFLFNIFDLKLNLKFLINSPILFEMVCSKNCYVALKKCKSLVKGSRAAHVHYGCVLFAGRSSATHLTACEQRASSADREHACSLFAVL